MARERGKNITKRSFNIPKRNETRANTIREFLGRDLTYFKYFTGVLITP